MNDNLYTVQELLSLQLASEPASKTVKNAYKVQIQLGEWMAPEFISEEWL